MDSRSLVFASCLTVTLVLASWSSDAAPQKLRYAKAPRPDYTESIERIVVDLNGGSGRTFSEALDTRAIIEAIFLDLEVDDDFKQGFLEGFTIGLGRVGEQLIEQMPDSGYARVLRVVGHGDGAKALVRFDFGDNGFGYREFELQRTAGGLVAIRDWYDYGVGQYFTDSMRQLIVFTNARASLVSRLFDMLEGNESSLQRIGTAFQALQNRDYDGFFAAYDGLDPELKRNRLLMLIAVQAGSMSGDEALYRRTLADLDRYYGDDATLTFLLIDHYFFEERYDEALGAIRRFRSHIGVDDAALAMLEANIYLTQEQYPETIARASRAVELEPELENPYWALLPALSVTHRFDDAVAVLQVLEQQFYYEFEPSAFAEEPLYAGLVESDAFDAWARTR